MKNIILHSSRNIQLRTIRLISFVVAAHDFEIRAARGSQPYLQTDERVVRPVRFKTVVSEFELSTNEAVQLLELLCGLSQPIGHRSETVENHDRNELEMKVFHGDPNLYVGHGNEEVNGL